MIKYIVPALILGALVGYFNNVWNVVPNALISDQLFTVILMIALFVFGFSFGLDKDAFQKMKKTGAKILVFPILVTLGSLVGSLVAGLVLRISVTGTMAVGSGVGWYTLAGPLLNELSGTQWGTLGFTANFLRELLTILTIPLLVRLDRYAPVASGGATTMDATLPLIVRYCGKDMMITAFSNGLVLSLIAPFIIISVASL